MSFDHMSTPRDGPNPLRPYYIPPSIGFGNDIDPIAKNASSPSYTSSARDIFSDIDYTDYVSDSSSSTLASLRALLDQAMYKYTSVLLAQPFEVAKTILQVRTQAGGSEAITLVNNDIRNRESYRNGDSSDYPSDDDSDPDEPAYFTSSAPSVASYSPSRSRRRNVTDRAGYVIPSSSTSAAHRLMLKRTDSILEVLGQLWTREGMWGVWKGSNATFVFSMLLRSAESWSRSFLAALANVPDPGAVAGLGPAVDVVDSIYPWTSLGVAVAAAALAGVILAPLDIVRTKLIITSTTTGKNRGLLQTFKQLPSLFCPATLYIPTILHSITVPLFTHATPLILRSRLGIDQVLTPTTFSIATFLSSSLELFVKLPIETVLRRGQMSAFNSSATLQKENLLADTIVEVGPYKGVVGTMWTIAMEEGEPGSRPNTALNVLHKRPEKKGQGVEGLWRGWRVGMWGLVGMWGAAAIGGIGGSGGEF